MYKGPRLKSAPFAPFNRAFLPEQVMRKAGFVKSSDMPYERNSATRETHQEYYKVTQESMFGAPTPKVLRLDSLREKLVISTTEKGRGHFFEFAEIKSVRLDEFEPIHVTIRPADEKLREMTFRMESPELASQFVQRLETLVQARNMGDK
jgi:hypothetical protein